ncbi:CaiB/BaiF CoA transferase family protein [Pseudomonas sp. N040]|uniref:CaiB/BaiF CoA transferase family protein n=1 Tax=Pseudomonas sp. N040 TaxID=2785325 RepID=UPI0018A2C673|nr:CoA transferase [Pseudomonas sp. N040]MBF7730561.1 CoA transferase [Pseudomonas sp. N040]MBW7014205.1 CoA transferase [Pseudomonas sp. N040]
MLSSALKGIRVIDFTQVVAGPTCTQTLADMGAEVIKIEAPGGDLCRALPPFVGGESLPFMAINRDKQSVVLDLKDPAQVARAIALIDTADILVECFRPGVMQRLGLGYEALRERNPRLIYCSISAYGQHSPDKDLPGVDGVIQAVSGLMSVTGMPDSEPCKVQVPVVDMVTGYLASISVLGALALRQREGVGQQLDVSMFGSAIALQQLGISTYLHDREIPARTGSAAPYSTPNEALRCADGWIMVAAYHPARWQAFCRVLGVPELADDSRFAEAGVRLKHRAELIALLEQELTKRSKHEWLPLLQQADIICGVINDYREVVGSPAFQAANLVETCMHPSAGELSLPRSPFQHPGSARRPAPRLGENTHEVLGALSAAD